MGLDISIMEGVCANLHLHFFWNLGGFVSTIFDVMIPTLFVMAFWETKSRRSHRSERTIGHSSIARLAGTHLRLWSLRSAAPWLSTFYYLLDPYLLSFRPRQKDGYCDDTFEDMFV